MAVYFRFDLAIGEASRLGMAPGRRLGRDNYVCSPSLPFVVEADGRLGAEGTGRADVARLASRAAPARLRRRDALVVPDGPPDHGPHRSQVWEVARLPGFQKNSGISTRANVRQGFDAAGVRA